MGKAHLFVFLALFLMLPVCAAGWTGDNPPDDLVFQETGQYGVVFDSIPNLGGNAVLGTFNIVGIPPRSAIVKAYLYLNAVELDDVYKGAGGIFDTHSLSHRYPADYVDRVVFSDIMSLYFTGYAWDVTSFVHGDGAYFTELHGPMYCASMFLIVVFEDADQAVQMVSITMGEEALGPAATGAYAASTVGIPNIGAGQGILILFGESLFAPPSYEEKLELNGAGGVVDVFDELGDVFGPFNVPTIDGVNTIELSALRDYLLWKIVVLISPPGFEPDPWDKIEAKLDRDLPRIEEKLDYGIPPLEEKLDKLDPTVGRLEEKLDDMDPAVRHLEEKLDDLDPAVGRLEEKLDNFDFGDLDESLAKLEAKADRMDDKVDPLGDQLEVIESKIDEYFGDISLVEIEEKLDAFFSDITLGQIEEKLDDMAEQTDKGLEDVKKLEAKTDTIGDDLEKGLEHLFQIPTSASIDKLEAKLDDIGPYVEMVLWDEDLGLAMLHDRVIGLEAKEDDHYGDTSYKLEYLYATHSTQVIMDLARLEEKAEEIQYAIDGEVLHGNYGLEVINFGVNRLEDKLDEDIPDLFNLVNHKLDVGELWRIPTISTLVGTIHYYDLPRLEEKLDEGVLPGIGEIIELLNATEATMGAIEAKLDEMLPLIWEMNSLLPDIAGVVSNTNGVVHGIHDSLEESVIPDIQKIESKLDGEINSILRLIDNKLDDGQEGLKWDVARIEHKLDGEIDSILNGIDAKVSEGQLWRVPTISTLVSQMYYYGLPAIEAKLDDGQEGLRWEVARIEHKLDGEIDSILNGIDAKVTAGQLWRVPTISTLVSQMYYYGLPAIEAKLDDGQEGLRWEVARIEHKLDGEIDSILNGIDAKVTGGQLWRVPTISTLVSQIHYYDLPGIEAKLDEEVIPPLDGIEFKIDQVELKILHLLLEFQDRCLPPIAFTPVSINPHGKLEELLVFVGQTLDDLEAMGYQVPDATGYYSTALAKYESSEWRDAGFYARTAYHSAMSESGACGGAQ
ncbi:MAG: hypothetical protein JW759_07365 [Candidatus Coatesbacteria bacterium]|nr:hypothetical protein [Candidatus Coatesbacteria bacterium]